MKVKVSEATGEQLNWLTAKCLSVELYPLRMYAGVCVPLIMDTDFWAPTTDWAQGGPIIEREGIELSRDIGVYPELEDGSLGTKLVHKCLASMGTHWEYGPTPLIAAMRCLVSSKLGDEVEIPEELL